MQRLKKDNLFTKNNALQLLCIFPVLRLLFKMILEFLIGNTLSNVIVYGMVPILFFCIWSIVNKTINEKDILFFCIWTAILFFNVFFLEKEKKDYLNHVIVIIIKCYPMYFIGKVIQKKESDLDKALSVCPIIVSACYIFYEIMTEGNIYLGENYSQNIGYALLMAGCISIYLILEGKLYQLPFATILVYGILISGARGPLLCIVLAVVLMVIRKFGKKSVKNFIIVASAFFLISILLINYENILESFILISNESGYSTRTFQLLLSGDFFASGGRNALYDAAIKGISENSILGIGIFKDRQYLMQLATFSDRRRANGSSMLLYEHNIFLEWLLQYGIIIGTIIIFTFLGIVTVNFRKCSKEDSKKYLIFITLLARGFFPLLVSGTYTACEEYYLLMGFMIANLEESKLRKY